MNYMSVGELMQVAEKAVQRAERLAEMSLQDPFEINEQCKKCFLLVLGLKKLLLIFGSILRLNLV